MTESLQQGSGLVGVKGAKPARLGVAYDEIPRVLEGLEEESLIPGQPLAHIRHALGGVQALDEGGAELKGDGPLQEKRGALGTIGYNLKKREN